MFNNRLKSSRLPQMATCSGALPGSCTRIAGAMRCQFLPTTMMSAWSLNELYRYVASWLDDDCIRYLLVHVRKLLAPTEVWHHLLKKSLLQLLRHVSHDVDAEANACSFDNTPFIFFVNTQFCCIINIRLEGWALCRLGMTTWVYFMWVSRTESVPFASRLVEVIVPSRSLHAEGLHNVGSEPCPPNPGG